MPLARILSGAAFAIAASYSLGRICLRRIPAPKIMALPVGAAILSLLVFLLLLTGAAFATSFLAFGVCALILQLWRHHLPKPNVKHEPVDRISAWILTGIFSAYGALYLVHALAPEIQPDALYYHLGQVSEYSRLGKFPAHIDFYSVLPQGMEMVYLFAFAFGQHPAAKQDPGKSHRLIPLDTLKVRNLPTSLSILTGEHPRSWRSGVKYLQALMAV